MGKQMHFNDFIGAECPAFKKDDPMTWCDFCQYDQGGCCDYNEPLGRVCVLGSGFKRRTTT